MSDSNVMRAVTNVFTSTSSDMHVKAKAWIMTNGNTACELMWQAPAFDGTRYTYTVQNSTNLISDPWHDAQGSVVWPSAAGLGSRRLRKRIRSWRIGSRQAINLTSRRCGRKLALSLFAWGFLVRVIMSEI